MILQLREMEEIIKSMGIEVPQSWHNDLVTIKDKSCFRVLIGPNGPEQMEPFSDLSNLRAYKKDNHNWGLVCKIVKESSLENSINKLKKSFNQTRILAGLVDDNKKTKALKILAERLVEGKDDARVIDIWAFIVSNFERFGIDKYALIAFDVESSNLYNPVQCLSCLQEINKALLKQTNGNGKGELVDAFGIRCDHYARGNFVIDTYAGNIRVYAKNKNDVFHSRYDWISDDAFPLSDYSRQKIGDLLKFIFSSNNEAIFDEKTKKKRSGLWFKHYFFKSDGSVKNKFVTVSTAIPNDTFLQYDYSKNTPLKEEEWKKHCEEQINMIQGEIEANPKRSGNVLVLELPASGKGQASVFYSKSVDFEDTLRSLKEWEDGIYNGKLFVPGGMFYPPNINQTLYYLNQRVIAGDLEPDAEINPNKRFVPNFNIGEIYELFFGDSFVVNKVAKHIAENIVPTWLMIPTAKNTPKIFNFLLPLSNLILHKLGFIAQKGSFMKHWAFCMGEIFSNGSKIEILYATSKGMKRSRLTGQASVQSAYSSPLQSLAYFHDAFSVYRDWAEQVSKYDEEVSRALYWFKLACSNFHEATNNGELEIPSRLSYHEKILMASGYSFLNKKKEVEKPLQEGGEEKDN